MSVSREYPPAPGGSVFLSRRSTPALLVLFLLVTVLVSGGFAGLGSHAPLPGGAPAAATGRSVAPSISPALTHGDLLVRAGQTYTIHPTPGQSTYYQGGNITVQAGGTLIVTNVTLSFVEFVAPSGTAMSRLSHIFHFLDSGTTRIYNSTVTTDLIQLNTYAKLNLTVTGTMLLWNSTFAFPGWVDVTGAGSTLTLNRSTVSHNSGVAALTEPAAIKGDSLFAPDFSVSAGGSLNLFNSTVSNLYADNFTQNGVPRPAPYGANNISLVPGNVTGLSTPTDPANLTLDWLYPSGVAGGEIGLFYNDSFNSSTHVGITVYYNGVAYPLPGTIVLASGTANGFASLPFTAALTNAINSAGLLNYLNFTGDFLAGPSKIAIDINSVVGPAASVSTIAFRLDPPVSNDIAVTGATSTLSSVDSSLALTFNPLPATPLSVAGALPWRSNKVTLTVGANAFLANLSVTNKLPGVFNPSAIVPDATSHASLFRWAAFALTGKGGSLPVTGGHVTAYYAYDTNQTNNATANALNALSVSDPAIWGYLQYSDAVHGYPAYATSGARGIGQILLASNQITGASLPDGVFLGGYHIVITVAAANSSQSFNWSVSPYPAGVAQGTPAYGAPDLGPGLNFPLYFAGLTVKSVVVTANGTASATVRIGQVFGAVVTFRDSGAAPITSIQAALFYNSTEGTLLSTVTKSVSLTVVAQTAVVNLTWLVTDSITGRHGSFSNTFWVAAVWNNDLPAQGGGGLTTGVTTTILPSQIRIHGFGSLPPTTLAAGTEYIISGILSYNGTFPTSIYLNATPTGGGSPIILGVVFQGPGAFAIAWNSSFLTQGVGYNLTVAAAYNTQSQTVFLPGAYAVPLPTTTLTGFLNQKFFGYPLWLWLSIAAIVAGGIIAFLLVSRRQAAGKLVECGECGNLIPENARVCPKCGAEFESDVVRCSRCASTIPASSKFCPECAAQLLGKPGEEALSPERQAYGDFTERYRAEAKKALGDNYTEGSFWDWWKRQPTYTPFSQWKLQQGQGTSRTGMTAPPSSGAPPPAGPPRRPPTRGVPPAAPPPPAAEPVATTARPRTDTAAAPPAAPGALRPCPSCGKEIPPEYLVCPFCGSVTQ